jgi:hypothetical protein
LDGPHTLSVRAIDQAGNVDQAGAVRGFNVDTAAPFPLDIEGGLAPDPSGDAYRLEVTARDGYASEPALRASGVKEITEYVNGEPVYTTPTQSCTAIEGSCSMALDHTIDPQDFQPNAEGMLHVGITATDQLGHETQMYDWDVPIPDTLIASGPSGTTSESLPGFTYDSSRIGSSFQCRIDGGSYAACPASGYTPSAALSSGSHTFSVRAVDSTGHLDPTSASRTFTVDPTAPQVVASGALFSSTGAWVDQGTSGLTVTAEDAGEGVSELELLIDGARAGFASQSCSGGGCSLTRTFTVDASAYDGGAHSAKLIATDAGGHSSEVSWTVNVNPDGQVTSAEAAATARASDPAVIGDSQGAPVDGETLDPVLHEESAGFAASGTAVDTSVARSYAGGTTVGFEGFRATFSPIGQGDPEGTLVGDDAAVYPNVAPGVDAIVRPTALGTATTEQIRSASATTDFSWQVDLAPDQHLEMLENGGVAVVQPYPIEPGQSPFSADEESGAQVSLKATADVQSQVQAAEAQYAAVSNENSAQPIAVLQASPARDASGQAIPVSLSISGNVVTMHVAVGAGATYPVLARPMLSSAAALDSAAICSHAFRARPEWRNDACFGGEFQLDPEEYDGPDIPNTGPQDDRVLWDVDPEDLRAHDEAEALMDQVDALGGSGGCATISGCYDLNRFEWHFCWNHPELCAAFNSDRYIAYDVTEDMFTGNRANSDNTRANAFQHAYWTGLMTGSAAKKGQARQAIKYAKLHEGREPQSNNGARRRGARMDIINNRIGYYFIGKHARHRSDPEMCRQAEGRTKRAINIDVDANPYNYRGADREVFRRIHTTGNPGTDVHFNGTSCAQALN